MPGYEELFSATWSRVVGELSQIVGTEGRGDNIAVAGQGVRRTTT